MRKTRKEIIEEEIEDCHTIVETAYIEQDIALMLGETQGLNDIGDTIKSILNRIKALKQLLYKTEHPEEITHAEDFVGHVIITNRGTEYGKTT